MANTQQPRLANVGLLGRRSGVWRDVACSLDGQLSAARLPSIENDRDAGSNDSDKTLTVPAGELWHVVGVFVDFSATATAGTRLVWLEIRDDSDVVHLTYRSPAGISANQQRIWTWQAGASDYNSFAGTLTHMSLSNELWLPEGWDLRVYDQAAIEPNGDDMVISVTHDTILT